jgi:hypothetical protein
MKKALKFIGGLFGALILILIIALIVDISNDDTTTEKENTKTETIETNETETTKTEPPKTLSWEEKVKEVAASDGTETEKFDEISKFAKDYKPTNQEVKEFEEYIVQEYKNGKYIMDISNHEYMLGNIFKAQVVEQYYYEGVPMKDFAFDFWQNSKYTYRGVDAPDSTPVKSNEEQMDKALAEMGK